MTMVGVYKGAIDLKAWRASVDLVLRISPAHDTTYYRLTMSPPMIIFLRVLLPASSVWTALRALRIFALLRRSFKNSMASPDLGDANSARTEVARFGAVISLVIGLANPIMMLLWSTGLFGAYALPISFYLFFFTLLDGSSLFATVLFAFLMRQQVRSTRQVAPLPQGSVWKQNRLVIILPAIVFVGGDFAVGIMVMSGYLHVVGIGYFMIVLSIYLTAISALIGSYFFIQAVQLGIHLARYLRMRDYAAGIAIDRNGVTQIDSVLRAIYLLAVNG